MTVADFLRGDRPDCPVEPMPATPPPSTLTELREVLIDYDLSQPRTIQKELGPSELGGKCIAQIARKLAGAPTQPVREPMWAPWQGGAVHTKMEDVLAFWNKRLGRERFLAEQTLQIDADIIGHGDAYDTDTNTVIDWKYVGVTALKELRSALYNKLPSAEQMKQTYRIQTHIYGWGYEQLGYDVKWVRVVLLARSWKFDDSAEWTEAYDKDLVDWAIKRYDSIKEMLKMLNIEQSPEAISLVPRTPGSECAWCDYKQAEPTNWAGCEGDVARRAKITEREMYGIIPA